MTEQEQEQHTRDLVAKCQYALRLAASLLPPDAPIEQVETFLQEQLAAMNVDAIVTHLKGREFDIHLRGAIHAVEIEGMVEV